MLGNQVELWETILAAMKLGAVVIPATPLLGPSDLVDRVERGDARHVVASARDAAKFDRRARRLHAHRGRRARRRMAAPTATPTERRPRFAPDGPTAASDPLLLYFTSGTTDKPKLVEHSHVSYPVGHLSTMYWTGIQPGDVHLNVSSPGWGKHAWSNVYAPWLAEATVMVLQLHALRRARAARSDGPLRRDDVLRAADGVADADPGGPRSLVGAAARGAVRRRAAQPRGDRAGPAHVGHHGPRRLRADRDDGPDRQLAGPAGEARLDGPPAARLPRSRCWTPTAASRSTRGRSPSTSRGRRSA